MIYKYKNICEKYENITIFICQITILHLFDFIIKKKKKHLLFYSSNFNIDFTG